MADRMDPATEAFVAHRNLLFTVAYEMLGSAADAEDVLQETWLRWAGVDLDTVRDQRAYLVRITTRQALSRLRTLGRRKESYVGPWLPEPLLTAPDVAEDVELADSVSMAMLLVLETLTPTERAVFVLREVFDLEYDEIAEAVDKSPAAVRQIAHRARAHVAARRPRGVVSAAETRGALEAFQRAIETGDLQSLLDMLAPDVVLLGDGGGVVQAVLRPVVGADRVARLLAIGLPRIAGAASLAAGAGQWLPGADPPARRRDRRRRGGADRRRPDHRALRRAQSREAVARRAGDRREPLMSRLAGESPPSRVRSSADLGAKSVIAASTRRPTPTNANTPPIAYANGLLIKTVTHPRTINTVPAVRAGLPLRLSTLAIEGLSSCSGAGITARRAQLWTLMRERACRCTRRPTVPADPPARAAVPRRLCGVLRGFALP